MLQYTALQYTSTPSAVYCKYSIQYNHLIPAITPCSQIERDLLALPVRLSGLGIINPVSSAQSSFETSSNLTAPLVAAITTQDLNHHLNRPATEEIKTSIHKNNREKQSMSTTNQLKRSVDLLKKDVPLLGYQFFLSMTTVLPYIKVTSEMLCVSDMVGLCYTPQPSATVVPPSQLIMQWSVRWVAFPSFVIMN